MALPSREVRAARWIEFAEFMESLPEEKFNHHKWCQPDHTCKTAACVAGWGALNYVEKAKTWLDLTFKIQALRKIVYREGEDSSQADLARLRELRESLSFSTISADAWQKMGREGLYLSSNTASVLFHPTRSFWYNSKKSGPTTAKDIALIFRYMATFKGRLGRYYNPARMRAAVIQHEAERNK